MVGVELCVSPWSNEPRVFKAMIPKPFASYATGSKSILYRSIRLPTPPSVNINPATRRKDSTARRSTCSSTSLIDLMLTATSKLFRLEGAGLRPIAELYTDSETASQGTGENESSEGGDIDRDPSGNAAIRRNFIDSLDDYDAKHRATLPPHKIPCYVGTIACCYQILSQRNMSVMACYHLTDDKDFFEAVERGVIPGVANIPPARHDLWFARLQDRVELGHCFGPELSVPMKLMQGLGRMVRRRPGGKWTWEMLTPEESFMYGYQFIICGLLY